MIGVVVILFFVVPVVAFAFYAVIKPFTHVHYHHPSGRLWRPLD